MEKKVNLQFDEREGRPTSILWLRRWGSLTLHPSPPPPPPQITVPRARHRATATWGGIILMLSFNI